MVVIQIIIAVAALALIPLCMICCKQLAFLAMARGETSENRPSSVVTDHRRKNIMQNLIVKTVTIPKQPINSTRKRRLDQAEDCAAVIPVVVEQEKDLPISVASSSHWRERLKCTLTQWGISLGSGWEIQQQQREEAFDDSKTCAICLESYENGQKIGGSKNPKCNHYFHLECITNWLLRCDKCALCREPFLDHVALYDQRHDNLEL